MLVSRCTAVMRWGHAGRATSSRLKLRIIGFWYIDYKCVCAASRGIRCAQGVAFADISEINATWLQSKPSPQYHCRAKRPTRADNEDCAIALMATKLLLIRKPSTWYRKFLRIVCYRGAQSRHWLHSLIECD